MIDMALVSGVPPVRLLDEGAPDTWSDTDLEVVSQYRRMKEDRCPGCGRPMSQHLRNETLGREETAEDYTPFSVECPAQQAISHGQEAWEEAYATEITLHSKGQGPDPRQGVYWLTLGAGERLPHGQGE